MVTPLRRFAQWPKLIAVRRMVGVAAFAYAFAHLSLYVVDQKYDVLHVASEIALRFYLTIGFAAWLGLAALSATSTDAMIKRLGAARWNRLHKLVYAIAALAIFHFYLQSKADVSEPVLMMGLYFILMLARLLQKRGWPAWGVVAGSALIAPLATALIEGAWYAIVRHIDFWEVVSANIDPDMAPRPSHYVALAGLAFVVVYAARNWRAWRTLQRSLPAPNRNGATSATPGGLSTANGAGRQTASAERPTRAVSRPLSTPSPMRAEMREAMPWPTICCSRLSPTAMPPVIAICAPIERAELDEAEQARPAAVELGDAAHQPQRSARRRRSRRGSRAG